ncbi:MAG: chemotaxis response regulator protein-glutamate methylesterase [Thermoanaerobaculaceae bacterium]|nr:chemotaxis response regulator protein-glutamate methylesterase [Thermoanaerobaculaceae bacterium]
MKTIKVAIADDSSFMRKALQRILEKEPFIKIAGLAASGEELLEKIPVWKPDVITLDISMPGIDGLETLDRIMQKNPLPVIIISTHSGKDAPLTLEALNKGAVDFIDKQQYSLVDFEGIRSALVQKILDAAGAKISPQALQHDEESVSRKQTKKSKLVVEPLHSPTKIKVIAIGASTGGPPAVQRLLESLDNIVDIPILVVQHMPIGFTKAFAERLNSNLSFKVVEAKHGEEIENGTVYIAPSGFHLKTHQESDSVRLALASYPDLQHKPSVDILFESMAPVYGKRALAVLLTGMGKDGAEGMLALKKAGAFTISEDEKSCVVYGMPRAAKLCGAVSEEIPLCRIGDRIVELINDRGEDCKR